MKELKLRKHWNNRKASNQAELKELAQEIKNEVHGITDLMASGLALTTDYQYLRDITADLITVSRLVRYNLDSIIERELQQLFNRKDTKAVELTAFYSQHTNSTISDWCEQALGLDATVNQIRKWLYDFDVTTPIEG